jgi:hypothetical protein
MDYWSIDLHVLKQELSVMCQFKYRMKKGLLSTTLITRANKICISEDMQIEETEKRINKIREDANKIHKKQQREETKCYWN